MRFNIFWSLPAMAGLMVANVNAAEIVNMDFETDQTSNFIVHSHAGDFVANFNYNYSNYAPQAGTTGPSSIPAAPSGGGTTGLRLEANNNDATLAADAVSVFPTAAAGLAEYTLKFDAWMQYNGPAGGGSGSTEYLLYGGNAEGDGVEWQNATNSANAFVFGMTGEGGATIDYTYTQGGTASHATADFHGANETSAGSPGWQALFPSPTYESAGSPGKAWTVVELEVSPTQINLYMTPTGGIRTLVSSFMPSPILTAGYPFVGYADTFSSLANPAADNFGLIDNLVITTAESSVINWSVY